MLPDTAQCNFGQEQHLPLSTRGTIQLCFVTHPWLHRLAEYARAILAGDVPYKTVLNEGRAPGKHRESADCIPTENLQAAKAHSSRQGPQSEPADQELRASVEPGQVQFPAERSQFVITILS